MSKYPSRQDREELKALLNQYNNLKAGRSHSLIEEDEFERIIEYFDEKEQLTAALEAAEFAIEQYPFSSNLLLQKASFQIALRLYQDALHTLEKAELYDGRNVDLFILKTEAFLALDMQEKAAEILESALDDFRGEEKTDLLFELADVYDDYENFTKFAFGPILPAGTKKASDCTKILFIHFHTMNWHGLTLALPSRD